METKSFDQIKEYVSGVTRFAIQEIDGKRYVTKGDKGLLADAALLDMKLGLKQKKYDPENGFTSLVLIPGSQLGLSNTESGLMIQFYGKAVDVSHRDAVMTSVLVMSQSKASSFISSCKEAPEVLYETLKGVNGGQIQSANGPMDIRHGENIRISANSRIGGDISADQFSSDFNSGYDCNQ